MAALAEYVPPAGILSARAATGVVGLLLIYLGTGLRHGKRRAWQVAVALAAAGVALHLLKGLDVDAAAVSAGLLALLIAVRGQFHAVADPRNRWRAVVAFGGFAAAGFALGFVEIAIRQNRLVGHPGVVQWAERGSAGPGRRVRAVAVRAPARRRGGQPNHRRVRPAGVRRRGGAAAAAGLPPAGTPADEDERGCGSCWTGTATPTRSGTSRCAPTSR